MSAKCALTTTCSGLSKAIVTVISTLDIADLPQEEVNDVSVPEQLAASQHCAVIWCY